MAGAASVGSGWFVEGVRRRDEGPPMLPTVATIGELEQRTFFRTL